MLVSTVTLNRLFESTIKIRRLQWETECLDAKAEVEQYRRHLDEDRALWLELPGMDAAERDNALTTHLGRSISERARLIAMADPIGE
jgi:hypothetical protein